MMKGAAHMQRGFIALVTVIIVSAVLVALVFGVSGASFAMRSATQGTEYRKIARAYATACVQTALLELATQGSVTPRTVHITDDARDVCTIDSAKQEPDKWTINLHASFAHSYVALELQATTTPAVIVLSQVER